MDELETKLQNINSSATAESSKGQDGINSLKKYKSPKKARTSKFDYKESSDEDTETDPYEEQSSDEKFSGSEVEEEWPHYVANANRLHQAMNQVKIVLIP